VIPQPKKTKSNNIVPIDDTVKRGAATIKLYVAAITDLYATQAALKINSNPHPRKNKTISDLIKTVQANENQRNVAAFTDRGRDGPNDGVKGMTLCIVFMQEQETLRN